MRKSLHLYWQLLAAAAKSQMEHRISFLMLTLAQLISATADLCTLLILFGRFNSVQGWSLRELALLYGLVHMGFGLAEIMGRSFEKFDRIVRSGDFDRILLRPLSSLFQVASSNFCFIKFGRFTQGFLVFLWGALALPFSWTTLIILFLCFLGTFSLFYGLHVLQATLSFWLRETTELMHILTYGGRLMGQFPITIFHFAWMFFFTYIVPIACVLYYPIAALLHHETISLWISFGAPLAGILFLFASFQCWKIGVHHYHSTGT